MVLRLLTTRADGNRRWSCSPTLSVLATASRGGMPWEKSRGLETSISTLSPTLPSPAASQAASVTIPPVQLKSSSPKAAASAKVLWLALSPCSVAHAVASALSAVREPSITSWPASISPAPIARPTIPVPRTPILMSCDPFGSVGSDARPQAQLPHRVLCSLKLRTACRRSDGRTAPGLGSHHRRHRAGALVGRTLRGHARRRSDLLQGGTGAPRRARRDHGQGARAARPRDRTRLGDC